VHGGILGMIADTARGSLIARGEVVRPGRTLTAVRAEVYARDGKHVASMQQTLMMLADTPDTIE
jgi:acyl-coenzyme A thioesterase PaaI-like protein